MGVNLNAPLADLESHSPPVMIFSHGLAGNKHLYTYFLKEWASRGFIVIAIDHDETVFLPVTSYEDFIKKRKPQLKTRVHEINIVLDYLTDHKNKIDLFGI